MPNVLNALMAFVAEHQRCGDPDDGRDGGKVWLACSCGAQIAHPVSASPLAGSVIDNRNAAVRLYTLCMKARGYREE